MLNVFLGCLCGMCGASETVGKERSGSDVPGYDTPALSGFELDCDAVVPGGEKSNGVDLTNAFCGLRFDSNCRESWRHLPALGTDVVIHVVVGRLRGANELPHMPPISGSTVSRGAAVVTVGSDTTGI